MLQKRKTPNKGTLSEAFASAQIYKFLFYNVEKKQNWLTYILFLFTCYGGGRRWE